MKPIFGILPFLSLIACSDATTPEEVLFEDIEKSGLIGVRPYPTANDICEVVGENELTVELLDDSATLIACPAHETGAIADRQSEGGDIIRLEGSWLLISMPETV